MDANSSYLNIKLNNRGLSLVELIVVILIMAILTGTAVTSAVIIHEADVSAAADELAAVLTSTRKTSLAREADTVKMAIEYDDGKYYARVYTSDGASWTKYSEQKLGGDSLTFTIESSVTGTPDIIMSETNNIVEFNFVKANGSLKQKYKKIKIEGSKTKEITVIRETGRCISE